MTFEVASHSDCLFTYLNRPNVFARPKLPASLGLAVLYVNVGRELGLLYCIVHRRRQLLVLTPVE